MFYYPRRRPVLTPLSHPPFWFQIAGIKIIREESPNKWRKFKMINKWQRFQKGVA
jgi:hypothetical protein